MSHTTPINTSAPPAPASALDPVVSDAPPAIPASFHKFISQAETYMHKAVETAKPYTDAVAHKTEEIIHQIQGQTTVPAGEKGQGEPMAGAGARGLLEQGLGRVSATLSNVTTAIDQKTATSNHPGWPTMLVGVGKGLVERVEGVMEGVGEYPASTSAAAAAVAPFRAPSRKSSVVDTAPPVTSSTSTQDVPTPVTSGPNTASTSSAPVEGEAKPVVTTTNSVAHVDAA